jgi:hypothetical protein
MRVVGSLCVSGQSRTTDRRHAVCDKDVSTPGSDHPAVEQGGQGPVCRTSSLDCLDPEVEGKHEQEDRNSLVIV